MPLCIGLLFAFAATLPAQVVTPASPAKFGKREIGGSSGTGSSHVGVTPASPPAIARVVSHYSFGDARPWKDTEGRTIVGKLIAFEDAVIETKAPTADAAASAALAAPAPPPPEKFTIIRNGNLRLLVNGKAFEVPLTRLTGEDRAYARQIEASLKR